MIHLKSFMSYTLRMTHKSKLLLAVLPKPYLNAYVHCLRMSASELLRSICEDAIYTYHMRMVRGVLDLRESNQTGEYFFFNVDKSFG